MELKRKGWLGVKQEMWTVTPNHYQSQPLDVHLVSTRNFH